MKSKRKLEFLIKKSVAALSAVLAFVMLVCAAYVSRLPDDLVLFGGLPGFADFPGLKVTLHKAGERITADASLLGAVPVKSIPVSVGESRSVLLSGEAVGIRAYTDGLLVASVDRVPTASGSVSPGADAGLKAGDLILAANSIKPKSVKEFSKSVGGEAIALRLRRGSKEFDTVITPAYCPADGKYRLGLWLRDSCAGIGTMTYRDPTNNTFAMLGHGVYDVDTGVLMSIASGAVCPAVIRQAVRSSAGSAGALVGDLGVETIGEIFANTDGGVYGVYSGDAGGVLTPVASRSQIKRGAAQILCTVDESGPKLFDCEITWLDLSSKSGEKSMILRVTDKTLLETTGGILRGMSGSPVIQQGRFVGAMTHVFVNDPTRGYAIFADSMLAVSRAQSGAA